MDGKLSYYFFSQMIHFSAGTLRKMILKTGSAEELSEYRGEQLGALYPQIDFCQMGEWDSLKDEKRLSEKFREISETGIHFVTEADENYPQRLRLTEDAPLSLFYKGTLPEESRKSVALIGARKCSEYGKECAFRFAKAFSEKGLEVISGMALGIDGQAGRGAYYGGTHSVAVMGGGVDRCYPVENLDLYMKIPERGCILSERPPGYVGMPFDFPLRNRIISGLSDCVCVIEAAEHSGSLITVNSALKQGKDVFSLPGRVTDHVSKGTNLLIRDGAGVLLSPEDIFQYFGLDAQKEKVFLSVTLSREEKIIFDLLKEPTTIDDLINRSAFPASSVISLITKLEMKGVIEKAEGWYRQIPFG